MRWTSVRQINSSVRVFVDQSSEDDHSESLFRRIHHESCPFFMGIYPSQRCTEEQNELHISLFHSIQKQDRTLFRFVSIFVKLFLKQGSR
ncbi:hypothetical protein ACFX1Z_005286 [Malus domestica]